MSDDSYLLVSAGGARFYDVSILTLSNSTMELSAGSYSLSEFVTPMLNQKPFLPPIIGNFSGLLQQSSLLCLSNNTVSNFTAGGTGFVEFLNSARYEVFLFICFYFGLRGSLIIPFKQSIQSTLIISEGRWLSSELSNFTAIDSRIIIQGGDIKFETGAR